MTDVVCLVENTTNISITARALDNNDFQPPIKVYCKSENSGFTFFNVTNLNISSVYFKNCGTKSIPADATKHINEPNQLFHYGVVQTTLMFNHCFNLTLYNVLGGSDYITNRNRASIVGVNLCGWSNITAVVPDYYVPSLTLITLLVYFIDSDIPLNSKCELNIESNLFSGTKYVEIVQDVGNKTIHM